MKILYFCTRSRASRAFSTEILLLNLLFLLVNNQFCHESQSSNFMQRKPCWRTFIYLFKNIYLTCLGLVDDKELFCNVNLIYAQYLVHNNYVHWIFLIEHYHYFFSDQSRLIFIYTFWPKYFFLSLQLLYKIVQKRTAPVVS